MRFFRVIMGLILIPVCLGFILAFFEEITGFTYIGSRELAFLAGGLSYVLVHSYLIRPRYLHVFEHELTHAFWGALFGGRVKRFYVSSREGFVLLSKTNFIITLAPYFFPFFTFLAAAASFFVSEKYVLHIFFLMGFTLVFHMLSAAGFLRLRQSDITETSAIFSIPFVLIVNLFTLVLILKLVSPGNVSLTRFVEVGIAETREVFSLLWYLSMKAENIVRR